MAHEVVNGANGSVTWCSGLGCPRCDADRELNERIRRGEMVEWSAPGHGTWHTPLTTLPMTTATAIPFGTTMRFPAAEA